MSQRSHQHVCFIKGVFAMKVVKASVISLCILPLSLGVYVAQAEEGPQHLYEAAQANPALKSAFEQIMAPVVKASSWLESYGTTAPPTVETLDNVDYSVYWGCKPHDCISESYVVMYDPTSKEIVAGAFVRNTFDGPNVIKGETTWLGKTDWDKAKVLGKYLY